MGLCTKAQKVGGKNVGKTSQYDRGKKSTTKRTLHAAMTRSQRAARRAYRAEVTYRRPGPSPSQHPSCSGRKKIVKKKQQKKNMNNVETHHKAPLRRALAPSRSSIASLLSQWSRRFPRRPGSLKETKENSAVQWRRCLSPAAFPSTFLIVRHRRRVAGVSTGSRIFTRGQNTSRGKYFLVAAFARGAIAVFQQHFR